MKKLLIIFLAYSHLLVGQQTITLTECQKLVRQNYPYAADKQRIDSILMLKDNNLKTQWYPQLSANAQATYQSDAIDITLPIPGMPKSMSTSKDQYKVTMDVNQVLYEGGSINAQRNANRYQSLADNAQNETEMHKMMEQLNSVYFSILLTKENISLLENVNATLKEKKANIESAFKNGLVQASDVDNMTVEILKNQQQVNDLKLNLSGLTAALSELTGQVFSDSLHLATPKIEISENNLFSRPELNMFEMQQNALKFNEKLTGTQRIPRLYAFAQAGYGKPGLNMLSNDFNSFYMVGLTFKWNIWDWNSSSNSRQVLKIQSEMVNSKKSAFEKSLRIASTNSLNRIKQLESGLNTDRAIVELRSAIAKRSALRLEQGVITSADYITDLNNETQSKLTLQTHLIQLGQEKANYLLIQGKEY